MNEPLSNMGIVHPGCKPPAPTAAELNSLAPGDQVKIKRGRERFWVIITGGCPDLWLGNVDNDLVQTDLHGLRNGDFVRVERAEIMEVQLNRTS
jgi:hypothetical protein